MLIGVDAGCLGITDERLKGGVYTVAKNLLIQLGKIDTTNRYYLYSFHPIDKKLLEQFGPRMKNILVLPSRGWMKIWLPFRLLRQKPDIFLGLNQALPDKIFELPKYRSIVLLHDIVFETYPEMYTYAGSLKKLHSQSKNAAKKADHIITVSKATQNDLIKTYAVPKEKITVAYPGVEVLEKQVIPNKIATPYFLFAGAYKKTKNIPTIIHAFQYFLDHMQKPYYLVLAGGDKWLDPDIEKALHVLPENIRSNIQMPGFVDNETLISLYKNAEAFISPSMYEGFGLPILEAMAAGCPVIVSNKGAIPEIVGYSGLLFDPDDARGIAEAMIKVAGNPEVRKALAEKGKKRAKEFTWERFGKEVLAVMQSSSLESNL